MKKLRILIVLSQIRKALEHEWFVDFMDRSKFDFEFILLNARDSPMAAFLESRSVPVYHFTFRSNADLITIMFKMVALMRRNKYDIVHTHLIEACLTGLTAARLAGIPRRILTRHHSDLHHTWHPHAVKYDKFVNFLATDIIAISSVVENILIAWEGVRPNKVHLIPHGININIFNKSEGLQNRVMELKLKYGLQKCGKVIGVISRFTEWKGVQYIIPAFKKLLAQYPDCVILFANATGDYKDVLMEQCKAIPEKNIRFIEFEDDIPALYGLFDYFVHVPISQESEAFGQIYVEALAARVPSLFTRSGIASDFAKDKFNCIVVPFRDSESILKGIFTFINNKPLCLQLQDAGYETVVKNYTIQIKAAKLEELYLK